MPTPLLWHFPISHYNEKARWALDWKRVPHRRQVLAGGYLLRAWRATGRATLPVLHLDGRAIGDSTRIIEALEQRFPDPPLYPADPEKRQRALAIEEFFDEQVGHPVRTLVVGSLMTTGDGRRGVDVLMSGMGPGVQRAFRALFPAFRRFYFSRHGIGAESRAAAPDAVRSGFDRIERELGTSGFLVGDAFSVADLTAAALLAPLVRPPGTIYAELGGLPEAVEEVLHELDQRQASAWVREIYASCRGESAAIPEPGRGPGPG